IAIINVPIFGRLVRSKVISLREEEYIMAAKAQGMKNGRIIFHHIFPNSVAPIIVQATLGFGTAILEAAALGFLGLGAQPPLPEWGKMLADSRDFIQLAPWTMIVPGVSIMLVVLGFNLIGDGLRDVLDPKMKQYDGRGHDNQSYRIFFVVVEVFVVCKYTYVGCMYEHCLFLKWIFLF